VAVTGADGLVGSWLCHRLVEDGAVVWGLLRDGDRQSDLFQRGTVDRINLRLGKLEYFPDVERFIAHAEPDIVFHLGAQTQVSWAARLPRETFEANIQGTWNLLDAVRTQRPNVGAVVVASSDKAYGASDKLPYTEDDPLKALYPYDVSKRCAEHIVESYAHHAGLPTIVSRCGNIFGGGDLNWDRIVPGALRSLHEGVPLEIRSDGSLIRDYIYVEDVVSAYLLLAEACTDGRNKHHAYNISYGHGLSVVELLKEMEEALGQDIQREILGKNLPEIPAQYLDARRIREELGWSPTHDLHAGLKLTHQWYERYWRKGA
jgi:CDP-glucose 4,6-dehydratase